jgi:hypothetical protein
MEILKIPVGADGTVSVTCPNCGKSETGPASLVDKREMTIACKCKCVFGIQLEFRKRVRRETNLDGFIEGIPKEERWAKLIWQSRSPISQSVNCKIVNLSRVGFGVNTIRKLFITQGDWIKIEFTLDDSASTRMLKKGIVRVAKGNYLGCEFFEEEKNDPKIGFYLL